MKLSTRKLMEAFELTLMATQDFRPGDGSMSVDPKTMLYTNPLTRFAFNMFVERNAEAEILDWIERQHTLHRAVEQLYVVDGYEVEITYDGYRAAGPWHGQTLRAAYTEAMKHWDKTHGDQDLLPGGSK